MIVTIFEKYPGFPDHLTTLNLAVILSETLDHVLP